MPISLADARQVAEPTRRPERLAFKNAADGSSLVGQALDINPEGIVTAIVSVTGTQDEVNDIIVPGAYAATLSKRNPKVCWAHSWERPVGRVLSIEELLPGDSRLPAQTKDGKPWPREAGALVATMQFNMGSDAGREAFAAVDFYSKSGECEYSIGYQVPAGKSVRDKAGVRHIKALDLYELSVVLFGAHTMTGTLSIKAAFEMASEGKHLRSGVPAGIDLEALEAKAVGPTPDSVAEHIETGVMVAVYPDPEAADRIAKAISGPDDTAERDELHVTLAFLGDISTVGLTSDEIVDRVTLAVAGSDILHGEVGGIGTFPPAEEGGSTPTWLPVDVPGLSLLRETIVAALEDEVHTDHGFTPHMTIGYDIGLVDPLPPIPVTFDEVKIVYGQQVREVGLGTQLPPDEKGLTAAQRHRKPTMPGDGDKFPIGNINDLDKAIQAFGRAKDKAKAKRWIIRRARELGATAHLPDSWNVTKGLGMDPKEIEVDAAVAADWAALSTLPLTDLTDAEAEVKAVLGDDWEVKARTPGGREGDASPVGTPGGRENWVDQTGGLPRYIRMIAHALIRKGMAKGRAIATAVATVKRWAAGGGKVSAKVQAAAAKAVAEWEANKAEAHAKPNKKSAYDPSADLPYSRGGLLRPQVKTAAYDPSLDAPVARLEAKGYPRLAGSVEERQDAIAAAVNEALAEQHVESDGDDGPGGSKPSDCYVNVEATYDDRVIVTRVHYGPVDRREAFEITYSWVDGAVVLGVPEPVELQIVAVSADREDDEVAIGDMLPLAEDVQRVAFALKHAHDATIETKAGRVLSGANEQQLRVAVGNLLAVLAAAGVRVEGTMDVEDDELPGRVVPNSRRRGHRSTEGGGVAGDRRVDVDPAVDLTTTSPSATTKAAGIVLEVADVQSVLARLLD